jgi:hypothetical protein
MEGAGCNGSSHQQQAPATAGPSTGGQQQHHNGTPQPLVNGQAGTPGSPRRSLSAPNLHGLDVGTPPSASGMGLIQGAARRRWDTGPGCAACAAGGCTLHARWWWGGCHRCAGGLPGTLPPPPAPSTPPPSSDLPLLACRQTRPLAAGAPAGPYVWLGRRPPLLPLVSPCARRRRGSVTQQHTPALGWWRCHSRQQPTCRRTPPSRRQLHACCCSTCCSPRPPPRGPLPIARPPPAPQAGRGRWLARGHGQPGRAEGEAGERARDLPDGRGAGAGGGAVGRAWVAAACRGSTKAHCGSSWGRLEPCYYTDAQAAAAAAAATKHAGLLVPPSSRACEPTAPPAWQAAADTPPPTTPSCLGRCK